MRKQLKNKFEPIKTNQRSANRKRSGRRSRLRSSIDKHVTQIRWERRHVTLKLEEKSNALGNLTWKTRDS